MIREAHPEEYPQLLTIQTTCIHGLADTYSEDELRAWAEYINQEGPDRYSQYENLVFVDEKGGAAGFVSWLQDAQGSEANIECLYTLPQLRGQGIGSLLLREAEANLRANTTVHIRSTINAVSFYERHGYKRRGSAVSRAGFSITLLEKTLSSQS